MNYFIKTSEQIDNAFNELMRNGEVITAKWIVEALKEKVIRLYTDNLEEYPLFIVDFDYTQDKNIGVIFEDEKDSVWWIEENKLIKL